MTNKFLKKLLKEEKLQLVEPSEFISDSYNDKSTKCLKSAKLLLENDLYENSIGMSYYAMYNQLLALLFRGGIKCENHSASILLLKLLFEEESLYKLISDAKQERIDKQYYVTTHKDEVSQEVAQEVYRHAEEFRVGLQILIERTGIEDIAKLRGKYHRLLGNK